MARIRSVHPGLFTDENYMALSAYAMAAWPGIWIEADDQGVFEWKPLTLKARLLPCAAIEMGDLLAEYEARGMVQRFEADGKGYGAIRNFRKFQRPEKPKCWLPLPEELRSFVGLDGVEDDQITELRKRKCAEQAGECAYCKTEITWHSKRANSLELDHVIPRARGGDDDEENLVASCRPCNRAKKDLTGPEFIAKMASQWGSANALRGVASAPRGIAPQMEDEGGRMEKKGSAGVYAFEGTIIRLTAEHFGQWRTSYHAIPDLTAELRTIDAKLVDEGHQGKWFGRVSGWLKARHEKLLAERKPDSADGDAQWRVRLGSWTDATRGGPTPARWLAEAWGPPPGQPGCRAPARLLTEFGLMAAA